MYEFAVAALVQAQMAVAADRKMQESLSPAAYKEWKAERIAQVRHRELCQSIERAGENARPRGFGLFW